MSNDIPVELRDFLSQNIASIAQLELLLLLRGEPQKDWTAEEAARALYTAPDMTLGLMEGLRQRDLLTANDQDRYRFAPKTKELERLVGEVADLYQQRRVTVINLIYAGPVDKLQSFADAFRIRGRKKEG